MSVYNVWLLSRGEGGGEESRLGCVEEVLLEIREDTELSGMTRLGCRNWILLFSWRCTVTIRVAWLNPVLAIDTGVAAEECRGVDRWVGDVDATTGSTLQGQR